MAVTWNGANLLQIMADNELAVAKFYREVAERAKKGRGAQFFEKLAEDEERHNSIYTALLKKHGEDPILDVDVEEDKADYLNMLMENNSMANLDGVLDDAEKIRGKQDVYRIAETVERDTVLFVEEIRELYPDLAADEMKIVLQEEKKHLQKILQRIYDDGIAGRGL